VLGESADAGLHRLQAKGCVGAQKAATSGVASRRLRSGSSAVSLGLYRLEIFIDGREHCLLHAPAPDLRPAAKRFGGGIVETEGDNCPASRANVCISHAIG
jgi:hypothetical protein